MTEDIKNVTRTGLILAVTLILQGLRLVIPIPPQVSMFVVGSLVNACLIVAVLTVGPPGRLVVAACTPVFAWLEGMLPFFPFVFPVPWATVSTSGRPGAGSGTACRLSAAAPWARRPSFTALFTCSLPASPFRRLCGICSCLP